MRLPRVRLSIRALCAVVLAFGVALGWVVHRARVQRDAVAAIERSIGRVFYDWQWAPLGYSPSGLPVLPAGLG